MEFNELFPEQTMKVLNEFPPNQPIVFDEETQIYSLMDTSDFRELQRRFNEYCDRICTSPDGAMRVLHLQSLLRVLLAVNFSWVAATAGIIDLACRNNAHERTLFVIVELLIDLNAGLYSLEQLNGVAEELRGGREPGGKIVELDYNVKRK
jgi:hypothetical protein